MNNKLFKRIVAAAASAVMLGSCAFATTLSNVNYVAGTGDVGNLSFTYNNGDADKVTYVAYAATKATAETDANAVEVNGTKYVLGEMVAINQLDNLPAATADAAETVPVDSTKLANADAIVLKSGDSKGSPVAIQAVALQTAPDYTTDLQNVTYNDIAGTVVRVYGLDMTKVVTVDGVTAKYYKKTDGSIVHVACVAQNAKPAITVAEGTPEVMLYGNANGDASVSTADATLLSRSIAGVTIRGTKFTLPSDLMALHILDVDANGSVTSADLTNLKRSIAGVTIRGTVFSLDTMNCYKK